MDDQPQVGQRIVVRTPDRREFRGELVRLERTESGRQVAVIRLDTGWLTSYPVSMVHADTARPPGA